MSCIHQFIYISITKLVSCVHVLKQKVSFALLSLPYSVVPVSSKRQAMAKFGAVG